MNEHVRVLEELRKAVTGNDCVAEALDAAIAALKAERPQVDEAMVDRMIARYLELCPSEKEWAGVSVECETTRQFCVDLLTAAFAAQESANG